MRYLSTRSRGSDRPGVTLDEALVQGIAVDGGLYLPEKLPQFSLADFDGAESLQDVAKVLLAPFFDGSSLAADLEAILAETFRFPVPTTALPGGASSLLELYHGPTAAFKDIGAGFLAACLSRLEGNASSPLTILVATSGDTGGAVAAAFDERPGMQVVVLFPEGRVSARQEQQLTCWGDNVLSLCVDGAFDDCQSLVKEALADHELSTRYRFSSANSINIGRLLPQATYYAAASFGRCRVSGDKPGFIIPTGNLGNAFACIMAREMGLPIGPIVLATNANRTIPDYFETEEWSPRASLPTLASAMDVGDPSNMERLRKLLGPAETLRDRLGVVSVSDDQIREEIREGSAEYGFAICPHTATASYTWRNMNAEDKSSAHWILVATAHPAKFETIVEPLIGTKVPLPPELESILSRPSSVTRIAADKSELEAALTAKFDTQNA